MAASFRSATTAAGTGTSVVVSKPSGVQDNDILIAAVTLANDSATLTSPSGWTAFGDSPVTTSPGGDERLYMFWKRASSEGATYTFPLSASTSFSAAISAYSGAHTAAGVIDAQEMAGVSTASRDAITPAISPSLSGTTIVCAFSADIDNSDAGDEWTVVEPLVKRADVFDTTAYAQTAIADATATDLANLYPSETLYPSEDLYPLDGTEADLVGRAHLGKSARPYMTGIAAIRAAAPGASGRRRRMLMGVGA